MMTAIRTGIRIIICSIICSLGDLVEERALFHGIVAVVMAMMSGAREVIH